MSCVGRIRVGPSFEIDKQYYIVQYYNIPDAKRFIIPTIITIDISIQLYTCTYFLSEMENFKLMLSEKGNRVYVTHDGFKFLFHNTLPNDVERWCCVQRSCFFKCKYNVLIDE